MTIAQGNRAEEFRQLHQPGRLLLLPNAWDAGSARVIEACGAAAIATTSAGLAWSRGYRDGNTLPVRVLAAAVAEIARVLSVPLTVDMEDGYSHDPRVVSETVSIAVEAGAVGINLEDGEGPADLLCRKIAAVRETMRQTGVDLFVNVRTDVYLRALAPADRAVAETIARARRYHAAGGDGLFVPGLVDAAAIRSIAEAVALPLNVMVAPGLPPVAELRKLGVRRVSAGQTITQAAYAITRRAATRFLDDGLYDTMLETAIGYREMNGLFPVT
jgi:2-methylisocitrate lyase-like PEP mutase family enzyme